MDGRDDVIRLANLTRSVLPFAQPIRKSSTFLIQMKSAATLFLSTLRLGLQTIVLIGLGLSSANSNAAVLPPDAVLNGKSLSEWAVEAWKWVYSIPVAKSPVRDCEGRWANEVQPDGNVFFIAPLSGGSPPPCVRTFTVPANKYLLVPVLVITVDNIDTVPPLALEQMYDAVDPFISVPDALYATVDGVAATNLHQYRATSAPFSFNFQHADNHYTDFYPHPVIGLVDPVITDGYWFLIEPLPLGTHVLHTGGTFRGLPGLFPHEIVANITVLATNRPPVADAGATRPRAISADETGAAVVLDASRSSDPDQTILFCSWLEHGSMIAASASALVQLPLGSHSISLIVSDGVFSATNSVVIEVVTVEQALRDLVRVLENAAVARKHVQPLLGELKVARQMLAQAKFAQGARQLRVVNRKIDQHLSVQHSALAADLHQRTEEIIAALEARSK